MFAKGNVVSCRREETRLAGVQEAIGGFRLQQLEKGDINRGNARDNRHGGEIAIDEA